MKNFRTGEILRQVCKELGLNNREVAEIISMTPQNVSRLFAAENVNTDTIDRLISALGVNIYGYLAQKWQDQADEKNLDLNTPEGDYFKHVPKFKSEERTPKISILIELDGDQQSDVLKVLNLKK